ncbi:hypothetical protein evm_007360 [Chilo suppressalis]|nr:hypothetical protein evm_007360 [Chilo suppressalis]
MAHAEETLLEVLRSIARDLSYQEPQLDIRAVTSGGANYTSKLYLATISSPGKERLHLFAKIGSFSEKIRTQVNVDQLFRTEHLIYTKLVKIWDSIQEKYQVPDEHRYVFPKYYGGNLKTGCETVVLEDLTAAGYSICDRFKPADWEHAAKSIEALAKFHALSFVLDKEDPDEYKKITEQLKFLAPEEDESMKGVWLKMVGGAVQSVEEGLRDRVIKFFESTDGRKMYLDYHMPRGRPVLVHGDYRPSNLFFRRQKNGVLESLPIDYQTVHTGCSVTDLIYFLVTASDEEFRRQNHQRLVEHYYSSLAHALRRYQLDIEEIYPRTQFDDDLKEVKTSVNVKDRNMGLVDTTVFLGITLDSKLQWGPHIDKLSNRLSSAAYAVMKIRQLTDVDTARLVYFSYFHSVMSYGILLWGIVRDLVRWDVI